MSYDPPSNIYREVPMRDWGWEGGRPREALLEVIQGKLVPVGKALDLCSERGWNALYLAQARFDVTALFSSPEKMEELRKIASQHNLKVDCALGSWSDAPLEGQSFDFVFDMGCFGRAPPDQRERFVERVHSVMKKEGFLLLLVLSYKNGLGEGHFTKKQIEAVFHPKFEILKVDELDSVHDPDTPSYISFLMRKSF